MVINDGRPLSKFHGLIFPRCSSSENPFNMFNHRLSYLMSPRQVLLGGCNANPLMLGKVWSIEDTNEVFTNYEDYLRR